MSRRHADQPSINLTIQDLYELQPAGFDELLAFDTDSDPLFHCVRNRPACTRADHRPGVCLGLEKPGDHDRLEVLHHVGRGFQADVLAIHLRQVTVFRPPSSLLAREHTAAYLGRVVLAIHMWERLDEAAGDLRNLPPAELFERFISWTR